MQKIYVVRHGETQFNVENKICGISDVPLTKTGTQQAHTAAQFMLDNGIKPARIISSPLMRARTTAGIISGVLGVGVDVDKRLTEHNYGIYEGKDRLCDGFLSTKENLAMRYPGGESAMDVAARVFPLLHELPQLYPDKDVLLVCHGGVARVINSYFEKMTNLEFFLFSLENCEVRTYISNNG